MRYKMGAPRPRTKQNRGTHIKGTNVTLYSHQDISPDGRALASLVWTATRDGMTVPGYYTSSRAAFKAASELTDRTIQKLFPHIYATRAVSMFEVDVAIKEQNLESRN